MELTQTFPITHKYGMHARASTKFVELAKSFKSDVLLSRSGGEQADGKSVLGILTLGIELGNEVTICVAGVDAQAAMNALAELVQNDFDGV